MYLMCKDEPVLQFDLEEYIFKVLNEKLLPYNMKDYLISDDQCTTIKEIAKYQNIIKTFFADRVLSMSRSNAKQILMAAALPQRLTDEQRCQISLQCRGVSVTDTYWVKKENETITYQDINIRNHSLKDVIFQVSIAGKPLSLQLEDLKADITTQGMFLKTWLRRDNKLYLAKTDKLTNHDNVKAEIDVSNYLDHSNVNHVLYKQEKINGYTMSLCECITNDDIALVDAEYIKQWCSHRGEDFLEFIKENFKEEFAKMVVSDYIFANTDRHINNWGFLVDTNTNEIISFAPLYDHNQALLADYFQTNIDDMIYAPTGFTYIESIKQWAKDSNFEIQEDILPDPVQKRLHIIQIYQENQIDLEDIDY